MSGWSSSQVKKKGPYEMFPDKGILVNFFPLQHIKLINILLFIKILMR